MSYESRCVCFVKGEYSDKKVYCNRSGSLFRFELREFLVCTEQRRGRAVYKGFNRASDRAEGYWKETLSQTASHHETE